MADLKEVLDFLEEKLDLDHIEESKKRLKKILNYEPTDGIPLRIGFSNNKFSGHPYKETFHSMEKMLINELVPIANKVEIRDNSLPMIRANYGVGTLPSLFGMNCRVLENNLPWVDHLGSIDEIKELIDKGIPDIRAGLGRKVFETIEYYHENLKPYEKCKTAIPVYHPDLQGPFDVAHLIWGGDIYYALYDEPELVHKLLKLVTETYIQFMKELKKVLNDQDGGYTYHWGALYNGFMVLRNDSAVNISKEMYEEFVKPYDEQIYKILGEGSMHYCGRGDQWIFNMMECKGLRGLNFGQFENAVFGFDFLEKIFDKASEKKIPIIGYGMKTEEIREVLDTRFIKGVIFDTYVSSKEEATRLLAEFS